MIFMKNKKIDLLLRGQVGKTPVDSFFPSMIEKLLGGPLPSDIRRRLIAEGNLMFKTKGMPLSKESNGAIMSNLQVASKSVITEQGLGQLTYNIAAASTARCVSLTDVTGDAEALTRTVGVSMYSQCLQQIDFYSATGLFLVIPWLILMENGEGFSNQDSALTSVYDIIEAGMTDNNRMIHIGPTIRSRYIQNSIYASACRLTIDYKIIANAVALHVKKNGINESNNLEVKIGLCIIAPAEESIDAFFSEHYVASIIPDVEVI